MTKTPRESAARIPEQINIGGEKVDVWPQGQRIDNLDEPTVLVTDFADTGRYHETLVRKVMELEKDPRFADKLFKGGCGNKVRKLDEWSYPVARLVHARAMRLCQQVLRQERLFVDDAWANIYRTGDYCMPHSHLRSAASVVYFLDLGDEDPEHPMSGRFCIADPRVKACCRMEEGRMTHTLTPEVRAGSMLVFPSQLVHFVNPYTGDSPRITLAWNINLVSLPGSAQDRWQRPKSSA